MSIISNINHFPVKTEDGQFIITNNHILLQDVRDGRLLNVRLTEEVKRLFHYDEEDNATDDVSGSENVEETQVEELEEGQGGEKLWPREAVIFLIREVEEAMQQERFETQRKKIIWQKMAERCSAEFGKPYTIKQVESKWKSLKRTYKSILLHNKSTGKQRRAWEYFTLINNFMHNKPDISPVATCSSAGGLKINNQQNTEPRSEAVVELEEVEDKDSEGYESSFTRKRKNKISEAAKRHTEKMQRLDRFNDLFAKMIEKM